MKRRYTGALLVATALLASGCGGSALKEEAIDAEAATRPFPFEQSAKEAKTAGGTVMRLLHLVSIGALPELSRFYSRQVHDILGSSVLVELLATQQGVLVGKAPRVVSRDETAAGGLVSILMPQTIGGRQQHTFLLERHNGRWLIVYDTVIDATLGPFVQSKVQNEVAPGAAKASPVALRAQERAISLFRRRLAVRGETAGAEGAVLKIIQSAAGTRGPAAGSRSGGKRGSPQRQTAPPRERDDSPDAPAGSPGPADEASPSETPQR